MSRGRRIAAYLAVIALGLSAQGVLAQSISIRVAGLKSDSMPPGPVVSVNAVQTVPELGPYTVTLEMSTDAGFQRSFYVNIADGDAAAFTTDSLLTEHNTIFLRARLTDGAGNIAAEARQQHPIRGWVTLIDPPQQSLVVLPTKKPRFTWSSPPTTLTAGLWEYEVSVISRATGAKVVSPLISDTTYVFPDSLESNASYRWQVRAHANGGKGSGEVTMMSVGTIVIGGDPTFTLLYQNFPNPFRRGQATCFWFDLAKPAKVKLTIYDLRLHEVRNIVPGPIGDGTLPVGAYGRAYGSSNQSGCDPQLVWDGRDDNGQFVPSGVYIAEFRANGSRTTRKILFRGP